MTKVPTLDFAGYFFYCFFEKYTLNMSCFLFKSFLRNFNSEYY